ncbi:dihydrofolate reductase family protein [Streptomyces sp. NPDC127068]|uniref:dihydrofolate reductase family protein n=1 Tax=Streptomyces sp. NPDC127068 TaxID=3347127 RepID=UPI0036594401
MRTFKLQVQMSVDGYMSGPNGEMDWLTYPEGEDISAYTTGLAERVDTIVLGRKLAEGFIPHWAAGPEDEPKEAVDQINRAHKVVISRTLTASPWENTVIEGGDLTETVTRLKERAGGDLIVYGGGTLVAELIARQLIDELHVFVNPVALGGGMPVFGGPGAYRGFRLVDARPFACGITALRLEPKRS